jgi:hypothetical protein
MAYTQQLERQLEPQVDRQRDTRNGKPQTATANESRAGGQQHM